MEQAGLSGLGRGLGGAGWVCYNHATMQQPRAGAARSSKKQQEAARSSIGRVQPCQKMVKDAMQIGSSERGGKRLGGSCLCEPGI